jgi:hypothetical protein
MPRHLACAVLAVGLLFGSAVPVDAGTPRGAKVSRSAPRPTRSIRGRAPIPTLAERRASRRLVRLYRGVRVPPNRFRTTGGRGSSKFGSIGKTWFSTDVDTAASFAGLGPEPYTTVIEVDVPATLFRPSVGTFGWAKRWLGQVDGTIDRGELRDVAPYVQRIGLRRADGAIRWATWDDALARGWFRANADYDRIFAATPSSP